MKLLSRIWKRFQRLPAPVAQPAIAAAPVVPMRQEQFPNIPGAHRASRQEDIRLSSAYHRLVKVNNANVTRNFGKGDVVIHHDPSVKQLTGDELSVLAPRRAGIVIKEPEHAPTSQ